MKTNKFFSISVGIIAAMLMSSCLSDFLDEVTYGTDYSYFDTSDGINALIGGAYQQTRWGYSGETMYCFEDIGSDLYMSGADGNNRDGFAEYQSSNMAPQNSNISGFWNNNYQGIASCNLALQYLDKFTSSDLNNRDIRLGEVLFLRAYYYYELVMQFGDIPLVLEPVSSPKTDFVREPQKIIWTQVISDLRRAWDLLPWAQNGSVTGNYGRASKGAAGHLLAKAYLYRYGTIVGGTQSDPKMQEDRGAKATDLDSVIYYASRVANFGEGAGSGSPHVLAENYSDLWGWDPKTGLGNREYFGNEILFSIQYSKNAFYNNQIDATRVNDGGNQVWMYYLQWAESTPLMISSRIEGVNNVSWGTSVGIVRDFITGRPWRRLANTPFVFEDNGLYGTQAYDVVAGGKHGKLIDARLYKSHTWVYYSNAVPSGVEWRAYSNGSGSFDPARKGYTVGTPRYGLGDTAIFVSIENLDKRFPNGLPYEKLALARFMEPYWYQPWLSLYRPTTRGAIADRDGIHNAFPSLIKYIANYRAQVNDQAESKNILRMRLGETYILLSEAYARKGDWVNAAATLNKVRQRGAWKDGELKHAQFWKYDGGTWADRFTSTENEMLITEGFLSEKSSGTGVALTDFYVEEHGRELLGELNRFSVLTRYGADYWLNRVKTHNYFAAPNIKIYHRFRPIPRDHVDVTYPPDPNPQNYGYF